MKNRAAIAALTGVAMACVLTACGAPASSSIGPVNSGKLAEQSVTPQPSPTRTETARCPMTIPPHPGFVAPEPYPPQPPPLYDSLWYGQSGLWTMLHTEGEVWYDLPENNGKLTQKILWWSDGYPTDEQPAPRITLAGRRLDGQGSFRTEGPPGGGVREDVGAFMVGGVELSAGCWELTARYRGAELSYVVLVEEED